MVASYFPFFFTRDGAVTALNGAYRGSAAFLIGSGSSFREINRSKLQSVWSMALNNAITTYRAEACCMVDDPTRFNLSTWLDPKILKLIPMAHFEKPLWDNRLLRMPEGEKQQWEKAALKVGDCPNVVGFRRNEKFHAPRWLHEGTVNWGNHKKYGGGRSVMLAALRILQLLGFRRVYLLGVDFEMTAEKRYHFDEQRSPAAVKGNMATYAKLQQWFTELQPYFLKEHFIVKNCNLNSRLTAFPFMPFEEALAEATAHLGDYTRERTHGMYRSLEEKLGLPPKVLAKKAPETAVGTEGADAGERVPPAGEAPATETAEQVA